MEKTIEKTVIPQFCSKKFINIHFFFKGRTLKKIQINPVFFLFFTSQKITY